MVTPDPAILQIPGIPGMISRHAILLLTSFLGGALRDFDFIIKTIDILDFCRIWHLRGFGSMEDTPTDVALICLLFRICF